MVPCRESHQKSRQRYAVGTRAGQRTRILDSVLPRSRRNCRPRRFQMNEKAYQPPPIVSSWPLSPVEAASPRCFSFPAWPSVSFASSSLPRDRFPRCVLRPGRISRRVVGTGLPLLLPPRLRNQSVLVGAMRDDGCGVPGSLMIQRKPRDPKKPNRLLSSSRCVGVEVSFSSRLLQEKAETWTSHRYYDSCSRTICCCVDQAVLGSPSCHYPIENFRPDFPQVARQGNNCLP